MAYRIEFSPEVDDHIRALRPGDRARVLSAIARELLHQPTVQTLHKKPLRPNPVAQYRLRVGNLRVYYDVAEGPEKLVVIKAVGLKVRDRVYVGGVVVRL